ncbi:MAG: hypothetical protein JW706_07905 [Opitutales bacterium]|nr:hypothetical protein [Opitutales bacterium]
MEKPLLRGFTGCLLFLVLLASGCVSLSVHTADKYGSNASVAGFLQSFEQATIEGHEARVMAHMATAYLVGQHDDLLEGRTDQFLAEFFGGYSAQEDGHVSISLPDIIAMELVSLSESDNGYKVTYRVHTAEISVECEWRLIWLGAASGSAFGFVGAWG